MIPHDNPYADIDKLDFTETVQQLRTMISEEYAAANLYEQFAAVVPDMSVKNLVLDIANEERVHAGEFESLVAYMQNHYGAVETDDALKADGRSEASESLGSADSEKIAEQIFPAEYIIIDEPDYGFNVKFV